MARNKEVSGDEVPSNTSEEIQKMQSDEMANNEAAVRSASQRTMGSNENQRDIRHQGLPQAVDLIRSGGRLKRGDDFDGQV